MNREYDEIIARHYQRVAEEQGLASSSTMEDAITRQTETDAIAWFVGECLKKRRDEGITTVATILDVGCGNGYTLDVLVNRFNQHRFVGVEKSGALRCLAESRFAGFDNIRIRSGDVRDQGFVAQGSIDILICQRVIINLMQCEDQHRAFNNMVGVVASPSAQQSGGGLLFIEAFESPLTNLNNARREFELSPISPAHHNLYLPDTFFQRTDLKPFATEDQPWPHNFLSTHYYASRVLHPIYTDGRALKRNSEFVRFFSQALKPFAGDYSPLKLYMFQKA
jgi:SAM-dependent methyltransferase